ncbi:hypothetical protein [Deinococcus metallilatus]|uniref:Uncharacterized protein n=1 Tax=Deinococcus metallilatus TaxID=1211322 RepID=A0ABR6MUX4_9DEIO|nr:hypothetical protein [Deinococcus metallilatus]MBB5295165.1 hypothetical protein [Deinococcus metallilatus]GMA14938.1 hypothetical protein GCM10025871_12690 [Deinococcus metallilatus]
MNPKKQSLLSSWPLVLSLLILLHFIASLVVHRVYHAGSVAASLLLLLYFASARAEK